MKILLVASLSLSLSAGCGVLAAAQPAASLASQTVQFSETAISPDGKHLAWVEALRNADGSESTNTSVTLDGKKLTAGNGKAACEEKGLAWSADSGRLAFLSDCGQPKQLQLYTVAVAGSGSKHDRPRKLTSLTGYLANPRWSPDGTMIALLFTANAKRVAGPLEPSLKDEGVVEEQFFEQRLTLVNADSGAARPITPADTYVYEFDWSPDGAQPGLHGSQGQWRQQLVDRGTVHDRARPMAQFNASLKPAAQIAVPRFTRDGRQIAFIGGLMSDEGSTGGDIYAVRCRRRRGRAI